MTHYDSNAKQILGENGEQFQKLDSKKICSSMFSDFFTESYLELNSTPEYVKKRFGAPLERFHN